MPRSFLGISVLAAILLTPLGGCSSEYCTLIGCASGAQLSGEIPRGAATVRLCREAVCDVVTVPEVEECIYDTGEFSAAFCTKGTTLEIGFVPATEVAAWPDGVRVGSYEVTFMDADGTELERHALDVRFSSWNPNGPDCEPTCHGGSANW